MKDITEGKDIWYIDMDGVAVNYKEAKLEAIKKNPETAYPQSQVGFFRNLKPIERAIKSIKYLDSIEQIFLCFLTSPSVPNPLSYMEKRIWIEEYFGLEMCDRLILSPLKQLSVGRFLVDDLIKGKRGQQGFAGTLLHFGSKKFPDWKSITDFANKEYDVCMHPKKYMVHGVFGGWWCPACDRNVDNDLKIML